MTYRLLKPAKSYIQRHAKHFAVAGFFFAITVSGLVIESASASLANTRGDAWGTVELSGADWMGGNGVDIYSNGSQAIWYPAKPNNTVTVNGASVVSGEKWQCVELVNRLFLMRGWTSSTWIGNGNQLYANAPSGLSKQANGSITSISAGDAISMDNSDGVGHAAVVTSVSGSTVTIANQNTSAVYSTATYNSTAKTLTMSGWAGYSIIGVIHKGTDNPPPPADTDGDGVLDAQDNCPTVYAKTKTGCPKSDFNRDGKADVTAFYRMDQPTINTPYKWTWQGKSDSSTTANGWLWQPSVAGSWDSTKLNQAGTGDFNGDGKQDSAAFYTPGDGSMKIRVWYGDGTGGSSQEDPWSQPTNSGWEGARMIPAGIGDYNNDGKDDIAAFFRHDNNLTVLNVWWGNQVSSGPQVITYGNQKWSANNWDGNRTIPGGVTDITGDGKAEIIAYYRHDNGAMDIRAWTAPNNSTSNFTEYAPRTYAAGSGWDGTRLIAAGAGDFDKDGRGDIVAFYRGDASVTLDMWKGQSNGSFAERSEPWVGTSWEGARMMPTGVSDYNGDGKLDIAAFYRRDNGAMDINIWYDQYGNTATYAPNYAFQYLTGSGWEGSRLNPVKW